MNDEKQTKLEAAPQSSEKDQSAAKEAPSPRPDNEPRRSEGGHPQYDSFMRIIRR
jgi:hypothetical protein